MKKLSLVLITFAVAAMSTADIQHPPGGKHAPIRKLSRAVANLVYGIQEVPVQILRVREDENGSASASYGTLLGVKKAGKRFAYGWFELVTFPFANWKGGYKAAYFGGDGDGNVFPGEGYSEFPPELGFVTETEITRLQSY